MKTLTLGLIKFYQNYISPLSRQIWPSGTCRFSPTCSQYAADAVAKKGVIKGVILTVKRISRCSPVSTGGFDPVS